MNPRINKSLESQLYTYMPSIYINLRAQHMIMRFEPKQSTYFKKPTCLFKENIITSKVNQMMNCKCILTFLKDESFRRFRESVMSVGWIVVVMPTPPRHLSLASHSCKEPDMRSCVLSIIVSTASAMFCL